MSPKCRKFRNSFTQFELILTQYTLKTCVNARQQRQTLKFILTVEIHALSSLDFWPSVSSLFYFSVLTQHTRKHWCFFLRSYDVLSMTMKTGRVMSFPSSIGVEKSVRLKIYLDLMLFQLVSNLWLLISYFYYHFRSWNWPNINKWVNASNLNDVLVWKTIFSLIEFFESIRLMANDDGFKSFKCVRWQTYWWKIIHQIQLNRK